MKAIKRTIASLLATLMLLTSVNVSFAEETKSETLTNDETIAIAKVGAAGIMEGTGNGFEGEATLTRAQAAAIMVRIKGIAESQVSSAKGTTLFNDVNADHWAAGYINVASNYGIINGVGNGKFDPERAVSVAEVYTMAIRALGAGKLVDSDSTAWPTNYVNFAGENELTDKVNQIYTQEAKRITAAQIIANTLEANVWEKESVKTNGEITWAKNEEKTLLEETLKIEKYDEATVTVNLKDRELAVTASNKANHTLPATDVAKNVDLGAIKQGIKYDVWYKKDSKVKEVIGVWESETAKQKVVKFDEIVKATDKEITVKVDGSEKKYDLVSSKEKKDEATKISYNNKQEDDFAGSVAGTKLVKDENAFGTITLDGSKVSAINIEKYEYAGVVDKVSDKKIEFKTVAISKDVKGAEDFKLTDDDLVYSVTKDNKEIKVSDIKEGDVVFYYNDADDKDIFNVLVATNKVEGKITSVSKTSDVVKYVKIDGKKYDCLTGLDFEADDEVVLYLNKAGKVVLSDEIEAKNSSYAIVKEMQIIKDNKGKITAEVVLTTADGKDTETKEIDIDETCEELRSANPVTDTDRSYVLGAILGDLNVNTTDINVANDRISYDNHGAIVSIFGQVVKYKEKAGKIVLTQIAGQNELNNYYNTNQLDKGKDKIVHVPGGKLSFGNKKYIENTISNEKYYFTDSTVFIITKAGTKNWKIKTEVVKAEDLDNSQKVYAYVANFNEDKEAKLVVLDSQGLKREKAEKFAVVLSKEDTNKEEYEYRYEVAYTDGTTAEYYSDEKLEAGCAYDLEISGEEITGYENGTVNNKPYSGLAGVSNKSYWDNLGQREPIISGNIFCAKDISNGLLKCLEYRSNNKYCNGIKHEFVLAKEVVFVKHDGSEYKAGKESDIKELSSSFSEVTPIEKIFTFVDEDGIEEVIAIVYNEEEEKIYENYAKKIVDKCKNDEKISRDYDIEYKEEGNNTYVILTQKVAAVTGRSLNYVESDLVKGAAFTVITQGTADTKEVLQFIRTEE